MRYTVHFAYVWDISEKDVFVHVDDILHDIGNIRA